jgi:hypothetical protein
MPTHAPSPSAVRRRLPKQMTIDGLRDALARLTMEELVQRAAPAVAASLTPEASPAPSTRLGANPEEKTP